MAVHIDIPADLNGEDETGLVWTFLVEESLRRYFGLRSIAVLNALAEQQAESGEELDDEARATLFSR